MAVAEQAEQAAKSYNPLFIYGGVGLGKTHLLNAIGLRALSLNPHMNVVYVSAESFMNELINCIRFDKMPNFRDKYRNIDCLLIDDIQFIAGKERTQEEFFHTFNSLHDSGKQIVVTSDKFPKEIPNLESRIRNRFEWGLIADIQPPDIETKVAIIEKKANENNINLPSNVAYYIASNAESNIREMEGFLLRIVAYASLKRREIDIELVKDVLKHMIRTNSRHEVSVEDIIKTADSVMIARGDMGVEIAFEEIPSIQKRIIKVASMAGKQVITATQMLQSMVEHPRPTRAEITDVANAIYDGTSAIMLSGETANGRYPVEALRTMVRIAERAEKDINYKKRFFVDNMYQDAHDITDAISHATCLIAYNLHAKAIITVTKSGTTAYMISRFRSDIPIIACTPDASVWRQMSLSWGVTGLMVGEERVMEVLFDRAINTAKHSGLVEAGDLVVLTTGIPLSQSGSTNLIKVTHVPG